MTGRLPYGLSEPPALSRSLHDRAGEHRTDEAWLADAWPKATVLLVARDGTTPVVDSPSGPLLAFGAAADASEERWFLGEHDGTAYFASPVDPPDADSADASALLRSWPVDGAPTDGQVRWRGLREVGAALDDLQAGLLVAAAGLLFWHARHTHCPRCGAPTETVEAGWSRRCTNDGSQHWPRTDPAVIMLIEDGEGRCILGRGASWPEGRYSILAGFVEPGESLEAAVAREVAEEVGVAITGTTYLASQPWPFPASLMLGFRAQVVGDPTIRLNDHELAEARWFTRDDVRALRLPPNASIAYRIISDWLAEAPE